MSQLLMTRKHQQSDSSAVITKQLPSDDAARVATCFLSTEAAISVLEPCGPLKAHGICSGYWQLDRPCKFITTSRHPPGVGNMKQGKKWAAGWRLSGFFSLSGWQLPRPPALSNPPCTSAAGFILPRRSRLVSGVPQTHRRQDDGPIDRSCHEPGVPFVACNTTAPLVFGAWGKFHPGRDRNDFRDTSSSTPPLHSRFHRATEHPSLVPIDGALTSFTPLMSLFTPSF